MRLSPQAIVSQSVSSSLLIVNKDSGAPIPYAIISNIEQTQGGYANEAGFFDFGVAEFVAGDSILISAIGYLDLKVEAKSLSLIDTIRLEPSNVSLSEVVVTASYPADKNSDNYLGVNQKKNDSGLSCCNEIFGSEYAVQMLKNNVEDEIDQIYIYFPTQTNISRVRDAPFKIKIYGDEGGRPAELLHSLIVKPEKKLKKWSAINLLKEGLILNM